MLSQSCWSSGHGPQVMNGLCLSQLPLTVLVDEAALFCCISPGRMFSGIEMHFSASFPPASSLRVFLEAHSWFFCLLAFLQVNVCICSQAVSMCFIYLGACLHSPFFIFSYLHVILILCLQHGLPTAVFFHTWWLFPFFRVKIFLCFSLQVPKPGYLPA